jgi:hypothetical protein
LRDSVLLNRRAAGSTSRLRTAGLQRVYAGTAPLSGHDPHEGKQRMALRAPCVLVRRSAFLTLDALLRMLDNN